MFDLIVIGGGPAGTAAAITAARNSGARVLLLERGRFPRHKVCGEFVSSESLDLLAQLLDGQHARLLQHTVRIPSARVFLDGRRLATTIVPPAASIARLELDAALWESAENCGVAVRQLVHVQSVNGSGPFLVATSAGEFEGRAVINASGRWSNLNAASDKHSRRNKKAGKWLGVKAHFAEISPPASVDLYFFDGGYCGVQPVALAGADSGPGRINACAMVRADVANSLSDVFTLHPALRVRAQSWTRLSEPVSTSPLVFRDPEPERDSILLAGDAAAFVDPFVGDGISLALRSGALSAHCLMPFLRGEIPLVDAVNSYRRNYNQQLGPVFRMSSRIRRMLGLPRVVREPALFVAENFPAVTRYLVRRTR